MGVIRCGSRLALELSGIGNMTPIPDKLSGVGDLVWGNMSGIGNITPILEKP